MINKFFSEVVCINLARRKDRWAEFCGESSKHSLTVTRFDAVDGRTCGIPIGKPAHQNFSPITPGGLGCVLSHYNVIRLAKEKNLDNILILEDDAVFADNFAVLSANYLSSVPADWDFIYFGGNHMCPLVPINQLVGKANFTLTTHAVAVRNTVYDRMIGMLGRVGSPIDIYYASLQQYVNAYAPMETLCWQRDGFSDILSQYVNYDSLLKS